MSYQVNAVANEFYKLSTADGEALTAMKLQKLIYFAHGWHLALYEDRLLKEPVEAWRYGPVVSQLYCEFKEFGSQPIERLAPTSDVLDSRALGLIRRIWKVYGGYTASRLMNMVHQGGGAWSRAIKEFGLHGNGVIPDSFMKEYFKKLAENKFHDCQ